MWNKTVLLIRACCTGVKTPRPAEFRQLVAHPIEANAHRLIGLPRAADASFSGAKYWTPVSTLNHLCPSRIRVEGVYDRDNEVGYGFGPVQLANHNGVHTYRMP